MHLHSNTFPYTRSILSTSPAVVHSFQHMFARFINKNSLLVMQTWQNETEKKEKTTTTTRSNNNEVLVPPYKYNSAPFLKR